MRIVWRFLIIALGLASSIIIGRVISVEALAAYSLYTITSLLVAEIAHMSVDQPMVRVLRSGEKNLNFWWSDVLIGIGVACLVCGLIASVNRALDIKPLLTHALATYLIKCLYPIWVVNGAKDRAVLMREGGITILRFLGIVFYIVLASRFVDSTQMMTVVGYVYLSCALGIFYYRVRKMPLRLETGQMASAVLFHLSYVRLYLATAPVSVFNTLVAMRLGAVGASELLATFHILSRFFSPVNIYAIMQISRYNLDILDKLRAQKSVRPILINIIWKNVLAFLAVATVIALFSNHLLSIWDLENASQSLLIVPLAMIALGIALSGPWLIIFDYFGHANAASLFGLVACIILGLGSIGFSGYTAYIIFGAFVLFADRIIKSGFVLALTRHRQGRILKR